MFDQRWSEDKPIEFAVHQIIGAVINNEFRRLKQLLKDFPHLDLVDILSPSLETLLHLACSNASQNIVEIIVEYFQESAQKTARLEDFLNMRNSEGFTSVHLASFAGKQKGADLTLANVAGLTAMHTASQGDQVTVMCYLKIAGLSIDQQDQNGRTPIHWAAYQSANNAVAFLLAWGTKFEEPDFDNQMTPLHYAVISGSTLIVRKLLQAGAKRNPKDQEGLTPIDHAITKKLDTIESILSSKSGLAEACNLRQPFEKPRKKKRLVILFCVLYLSTFFASLFFVIPYVTDIPLFIGFIAHSGLTFLSFFAACLTNPGFLRNKHSFPKTQDNLLSLLKSVQDVDQVCPKCEILQPPRSKHCDLCGQCVKVYDHHCPWINNCVGANNFKYFYVFVLFVLLHLLFMVVLNAMYLTSSEPIAHYFIKIFSSTKAMEILHLITSIICIILSVFFIVCVGILLSVQTSNLLQGITTSEKFGYKKKISPTKAKQVEDEGEDGHYEDGHERHIHHMNATNTNATDSISTTGDADQVFLLGSLHHQQQRTRLQNVLEICVTNNSNPRYNVDYSNSLEQF